MVRIGLTGGLGTGKTTVAKMLAELGAFVLEGDRLVHQVYVRGSPVWKWVVQKYGQGVIGEDGEIDRKKLSAQVFAEANEYRAGNQGGLTTGEPGRDARGQRRMGLFQVVQFEVSRMASRILEEKEREGIKIAVFEEAVLVEVGDTRMVDEVWVTYAPEDVVVSRVSTREGGVRLTPEEAKRRITAQLPLEDKLKYAHVVIRTDRSLEETQAQVAGEWKRIHEQVSRGVFKSYRAPGPFEPLDPSQWFNRSRS
jgi:dephospho-CoA kinase